MDDIIETHQEALAASTVMPEIPEPVMEDAEPKELFKVYVHFKTRNKHNEVRSEDAMVFDLPIEDLRSTDDLAAVVKYLTEKGHRNPLIVSWRPLEV